MFKPRYRNISYLADKGFSFFFLMYLTKMAGTVLNNYDYASGLYCSNRFVFCVLYGDRFRGHSNRFEFSSNRFRVYSTVVASRLF